jgi:hypothetical protein
MPIHLTPPSVPVDEESTRTLFEVADGMRHWWNDDNPDDEQQAAYDDLRLGAEPSSRDQHDKYVADLEDIVAELYSRFENGILYGGEEVNDEPEEDSAVTLHDCPNCGGH